MSANAFHTTICVMTLNRPKFIGRALDYYAATGFAGAILIADGSTGDDANETRRHCERHQAQLRVELIDTPGQSVPQTFAVLAERVKTRYAVYSGDDDFLIVDTLAECEEFLEVTPEVIAVHGRAIAVNMNGTHGVPIKAEPYPLPSYGQADGIDRVQYQILNYAVGVFSLHRSDAWRKIWASCAAMEDRSIGGEVAACLFSAALGRMAEIDSLYLIRQIHPNTYALAQKSNWVLSPSFGQSARLMLSQLTKMLKSSDQAIGLQQNVEDRVWNSFIKYVAGATGDSRSALRSARDEASLANLINFDTKTARQFRPVLTSMLGNGVQTGTKPRLLINWGNPYVMEDVIGPILPELAERFWIVLLLVDYRLEPNIRGAANSWKQKGLVADVLIAPSHGGSLAAHRYMADAAAMLKKLDFDLFVTISAMQPYERYLTDWILPEKCPRIVLWPHPTNLFLNPELSRAVADGDAPSIARVVRKWRAGNEPKIWREVFSPRPYWLKVIGFLLTAPLRRFGATLRSNVVLRSVRLGIARGDATTDLTSSGIRSSTRPADKAHFSDDSEPTLFQPLLNPLRSNRLWRWIKRKSPGSAYYLWRMFHALDKIRAPAPRVAQLRFLRGDNTNLMESVRYHTMDRLVYPQLLGMRPIPFQRLDWLTQIGTNQFDACLFFSSSDTEAHKILFDNPNIYTVRYMRQSQRTEKSNDAILLPFSLHGESDLGPELFDLYARDLSIALKESGATEVHLRPHPGRQDNWMGSLVEEIRNRGIPIKLVTAEQPITEAAAQYQGVVGAVSASLRDVRLSCPHLFVVGSMGLSVKGVSNPKGIIGFAESIGWIEVDGSYDPKIFKPVDSKTGDLASPAEIIIGLYEGKNWNRVPMRFRKAV